MGTAALQTGCVSQVIYSLTVSDAAILRRASSITEYLERHVGWGRGDSDINIVGGRSKLARGAINLMRIIVNDGVILYGRS